MCGEILCDNVVYIVHGLEFVLFVLTFWMWAQVAKKQAVNALPGLVIWVTLMAPSWFISADLLFLFLRASLIGAVLGYASKMMLLRLGRG